LFKDYKSSPSSFTYYSYDVFVSNATMKIVNFCPNDPRMLNRKCCEGHGLDFAKVDLFKNLTSSIINDNPYAFDEGYLSDYCRFS